MIRGRGVVRVECKDGHVGEVLPNNKQWRLLWQGRTIARGRFDQVIYKDARMAGEPRRPALLAASFGALSNAHKRITVGEGDPS